MLTAAVGVVAVDILTAPVVVVGSRGIAVDILVIMVLVHRSVLVRRLRVNVFRK